MIEPRVHLIPDPAFRGHFNVLRGYVAPLGLAGVKVVSDYVDNYRQGLPSEMGLLNLFDPRTGVPIAVIDAAGLTDMRTGAVTAIGAKHLGEAIEQGARPYRRARHRVLECASARPHFRFRRDSRAFAPGGKPRRVRRAPVSRPRRRPSSRRQTGRAVCAAPTSSSKPRGSSEPAPLLETAWIERGALVVPYGTMSAVELSLTDIMDKIVVDDWGQCKAGPFGSLRAHVEAGKLSEATLHAELGEIVAGVKPGRERDDETNPVLAPRAVAVGHRARRRDARQSERAGHRPAAAIRIAATCRRRVAMLIANARMYSVNAQAATAWRTLLEWVIERAGVRCRGDRLPAAAAVVLALGAA